MRTKAPGKLHKGISLIELMGLIPDEASAIEWFESRVWSGGRCCGHCGPSQRLRVRPGMAHTNGMEFFWSML